MKAGFRAKVAGECCSGDTVGRLLRCGKPLSRKQKEPGSAVFGASRLMKSQCSTNFKLRCGSN